MKKTYNKLVRDKIPEIINSKPNAKCKTQILSDEEFAKQLNIKLQEEIKEYLESDSVEELADVEEVLRAILDAKNVSNEEFEKVRLEKQQKRGAFKGKVFLEFVDED